MPTADFFLQIAGIPGESADAKHKDWIDVESWSWGETNPTQMAAGGGAGAGKVQMQDFQFVSRVSKASPRLMLACANGEHVKEAKLVAVKPGAKPVEYLTWTFSDVLVSSYKTGGSGGDVVPTDEVSLNFAKVKVEYKAQKPDGTLEAGWDAKAGKAF